MEGVEARGVSHDDLISWSAAAAMRSERRLRTSRGLRCLREWPANAARQVSCQIVTVDHLLPKVGYAPQSLQVIGPEYDTR
jgi:hypothetical protein